VIGFGFQMGYVAGYMTLSGLAYQWRNWHGLQVTYLKYIYDWTNVYDWDKYSDAQLSCSVYFM